MRILWVKAGKLLPVDTGGKIRSYNILWHLSREHECTLLSYYPGRTDSAYDAAIKAEFGGAYPVCIGGSSDGSSLRMLDYLQQIHRPAPLALSRFTNREVRRLITTWMEERRFDACVCDFLAASLNFPDSLPIPTVLFQHNVEAALWRRRADTESNPIKHVLYRREAARMAQCERAALGKFQVVIAVSEHDRQQMLGVASACDIRVVPTGVDTQKYTPVPRSKANPPLIVFTGSMDWEPNVDAVIYFCKQIFPRVRIMFPSAIFQIVGRNPHPRVRQLASSAVQVTGTVSSVSNYLREASIVVVPLRAGGGTRLKIYEAMAMGKAVVSTSIGAEGLELTNNHHLILADDEATFANAITNLLSDDRLRHRYEQAGMELAGLRDWSNVALQFAQVLKSACEPSSHRSMVAKSPTVKPSL